jgi:dTDP-4-amino-4,6-dideoxygalactose transaminase
MNTKETTWNIPLFDLSFDDREKEAVNRVLKRKWLTMGPENIEFERKFSEYTGASYCLSVNSCTAALHMAVLALELGPGDEVIVPSLTFVATVNAVRYTGATPVFADVTSALYPVIDPLSIEKAITGNTRAVIIVHYAGYPCNMDAILEITRKYNIRLIEDCAHSPGAKWRGKSTGTFGDFGCFSFFSNKNLSMGEGGAILPSTEEKYEKCRYLRSHGMTTLTLDRHKGHAFTYDVVAAGYNYRLDEMRAAIGLVQLEKLPEMNKKRKQVMQTYRSLLSSVPVEVPFTSYEHAEGVDHIMPVFLPANTDREKVMAFMKAQGIQTSIHYPCVHMFTDLLITSTILLTLQKT